MTHITIQIPAQILIKDDEITEQAVGALIPASRITGVLDASQIPIGVIPGGEALDNLVQQVEDLSGSLNAIQQAGFLSGSELQNHSETSGRGQHIPLAGIRNSEVAPDAAIEWSKINPFGLDLAALGAQPINEVLTEISELGVSEFGVSLLQVDGVVALQNLLQLAALTSTQLTPLQAQLENKAERAHQQPIESITGLPDSIAALQSQINLRALNTNVVTLDSELTALELTVQNLATTLDSKANVTHTHQTSVIQGLDAALSSLETRINSLGTLDGDLAAIAALTTAAFGRSLLELANLAALQNLLRIPTLIQPQIEALQNQINQRAMTSNLNGFGANLTALEVRVEDLTVALISQGNVTHALSISSINGLQSELNDIHERIDLLEAGVV